MNTRIPTDRGPVRADSGTLAPPGAGTAHSRIQISPECEECHRCLRFLPAHRGVGSMPEPGLRSQADRCAQNQSTEEVRWSRAERVRPTRATTWRSLREPMRRNDIDRRHGRAPLPRRSAQLRGSGSRSSSATPRPSLVAEAHPPTPRRSWSPRTSTPCRSTAWNRPVRPRVGRPHLGPRSVRHQERYGGARRGAPGALARGGLRRPSASRTRAGSTGVRDVLAHLDNHRPD
jgi:hypothetical protein